VLQLADVIITLSVDMPVALVTVAALLMLSGPASATVPRIDTVAGSLRIYVDQGQVRARAWAGVHTDDLLTVSGSPFALPRM
jgi:hypothetical protein